MPLTMKVNPLLAGSLFALLATSGVAAHHSFAAEHDGMQPVTVSGTVAKIEWTNPHIHFFVDVKPRPAAPCSGSSRAIRRTGLCGRAGNAT
jgi:hypothetical protein